MSISLLEYNRGELEADHPHPQQQHPCITPFQFLSLQSNWRMIISHPDTSPGAEGRILDFQEAVTSSAASVRPSVQSAFCKAATMGVGGLQDTAQVTSELETKKLVTVRSQVTCFVFDVAPFRVAVQVLHQSGAKRHITNVIQ